MVKCHRALLQMEISPHLRTEYDENPIRTQSFLLYGYSLKRGFYREKFERVGLIQGNSASYFLCSTSKMSCFLFM